MNETTRQIVDKLLTMLENANQARGIQSQTIARTMQEYQEQNHLRVKAENEQKGYKEANVVQEAQIARLTSELQRVQKAHNDACQEIDKLFKERDMATHAKDELAVELNKALEKINRLTAEKL